MSTTHTPDLVQQVRVKIAASPAALDQSPLIPVFHRWIRERRLSGRLLIDVADYRHVPRGPGVMLIGHDGHLSMDAGGSGLGLAYERKRDAPGPLSGKLAEALSIVLEAAEQLMREPELGAAAGVDLRFDPFDVEVQVRSRLYAPNTPETHAVFDPAIARALADIYRSATAAPGDDADVAVEPLTARDAPVGVRARVNSGQATDDTHAIIARLRAHLAELPGQAAPAA